METTAPTLPEDSRRTILLVEDNEDEVFMMQRAFRKAGIAHPLQIVTDGEQALEYLEGKAAFSDKEKYPFPVVVFLDLNLPRRSGLEILDYIRSSPALKKLNVNVLSSSTRPADIDKCAVLGANAYFIKPTRFASLEEMVRSWYSRSRFEVFATELMKGA